MSARVRRIRANEWEAARDLRLEALQDEAAPLAFLDSFEDAAARDDAHWQERAASGAGSDGVVQLVAESAGEWSGSATVLFPPAGSLDYFGRRRPEPAAIIVAVYVRPDARGTGTIDRLLDAAAGEARRRGLPEITLDVHEANLRAQAAYRRCGFTPTGDSFVGRNGRELQFRRPL